MKKLRDEFWPPIVRRCANIFTKTRKMKKLHHGVGAMGTILTKFIHPSENVRAKHLNLDKRGHSTIILLVGKESKKVNRKDQECYIFRSDDYPNVLLHAVKRYVKVTHEGPPEEFFDMDDNGPNKPEATVGEERAMPPRTHVLDEELQNFVALGANIDDDNLPAPENVPTISTPTQQPGRSSNAVFPEDGWGFQGKCPRKADNNMNRGPSIGAPPETWSMMSKLQFFLLLFPIAYCKAVIITEMNKKLEPGRPPIEWWEYLRWIGIWTLLATTDGHDHRSFWSTETKNDPCFKGAPFRLNDIMSRTRFEEILAVHTLFNTPFPNYKDDFHPVRGFINAWNTNMTYVFMSAWIVCLDESMSMWTNMWTCPGWVFCPRKPWDCGNEYHTIACGMSSIIFYMEMVEGKARPKEMEKPEFENLGKTVGLLLRLTRPIWNSGRVVVLDSGFCVIQAIVELKKKGVHSAALIKKRRYWPKYILGETIKEHFINKDVGLVDCWNGELDNIPITLFCMKEPDYIMTLMSTYGTVNEEGDEKKRIFKDADGNDIERTFRYTEVIYNHYQYRHVVDDNNNNRMQPISIEETWKTSHWPNRSFAFVLGVTGVNTQRAYEHFGKNARQHNLEFRRELAWEMIYNEWVPKEGEDYLSKERSCKMAKLSHCQFLTLEKNRAFDAETIVTSRSNYNQRKCVGCPDRVRNYCKCSPGYHRCIECYATHRIEGAATNAN
jgi:hypothetical protein